MTLKPRSGAPPDSPMKHIDLIAARMEQARWKRGISVAELARRIGVDPKRLWRVLNGERAMRADEFVRLCAELEVGLGAFLAKGAPSRPAEARPAGGDASRDPW
ncbi:MULTISPECIES: helix-turn-helix domain-containing protein [Gordonibacter]|uniref:Helix-turn-helix transcriptional regulator n=2 Tax=Gordonibacter TaxID=644652 RepID=A0ABT7DKJ8_9ACTN|nr:helix-turn-helix transcriptional regulator [Gordonibacter sp. KGMB12511]MDJ1650055.1 helix-turn-helix transcriptional regulator [Gordonibacter sp. KGMB12511]